MICFIRDDYVFRVFVQCGKGEVEKKNKNSSSAQRRKMELKGQIAAVSVHSE